MMGQSGGPGGPNMANMMQPQAPQPEKLVKKQSQIKGNHDPDVVKERLRKKLESKK